MEHWAVKYIGGRWHPGCDCLGWFLTIQQAEFGRQLPKDLVPGGTLGASAAMRVMGTDIGQRIGWSKTEHIREGDALFLSQGRERPHHLGVAAVINGEIWVIHALENVGVVASSLTELQQNLWQIREAWTCES